MRAEIRGKLRGGSTVAVASALYKRGLRHQMVQDVRPLSPPKAGSRVGAAYTLRTIPAREDLNPMTAIRDHSHPQRRAVEECPSGVVLVMTAARTPGLPRGRRHPGHPADGARRGRPGHRWWVP